MGIFDSIVGNVAGVVPLPSVIKNFGSKIANSKVLRIGEKVAGAVQRIGHKVKHVGDVAGKFTSKAASLTSGIPLVGTAAGMANKLAQGASLVGGGMEGAGRAAQGVIRVGRSLGAMKTGGDLMSGVRDMARASNEMGGATRNLVSQARSVGSTLQRRK